MPRTASNARDAAVARLGRLNRWLIAGSVVITGVLTDAAAQAFPGHTITRRAASLATSGQAVATTPATRRAHHHHAALTPAAQAPRSHPSPRVVEPVAGATPAPVAQVPATATPATPTPTVAPVQVAPAVVAPAPVAPAPVVSGGS